jgi:GNAT superfamily N-acetyltransferase
VTTSEPSPEGEVEIRPLPLEAVLPLRQRVLRPHQRVSEVVFDGDRRPGALHLGAFAAGRVVGVASVMPEPEPDAAVGDRDAHRIRGMAVEEGWRGGGIGGRLLERCVEHAASGGAGLVWCNARIGAVPFYERHGFERDGPVFDVPRIGAHVRMRRRLGRTPDRDAPL